MTTRPAGTLQGIVALAAVELRLTARRGESLLVTFFIPTAVLLFFSSAGLVPVAIGRPVDLLLPGTLALAIVATGMVSLGIATAYERHYGVLKRLGGAPITRVALIAAKMAGVVVVEAVQAALLVGLAAGALGWQPAATANPLLALIALGLGTAAFSSLGLAMAGRLRAEVTLAAANGLFLLLLMLGGIILPVDHLDPLIRPLASVLPSTALTDVLRASLAGADPGAALPVLAAWAAALSGLAATTFRWE